MNNSPEYWESSDIDYSNKVKEVYKENFTGVLKEKFDEFTHNMMTNDAVITSMNLMDALENFKRKNYMLVKDNETRFNRLSDMAFNYRPHQPCVVM